MIVLDTHALIWWVNGDRQLSAKALNAIRKEAARAEGQLLVSVISTWEIALLVQRGRLTLTMDLGDWIGTVATIDAIQFVPVDNEIAMQSARLPGDFHPDPADRMIVALARHLTVPLVSGDARIRAYRHVETVW